MDEEPAGPGGERGEVRDVRTHEEQKKSPQSAKKQEFPTKTTTDY